MKFIYLIIVFTCFSNNANSIDWNSLDLKQQQLLAPFASDWNTLDDKTQDFLANKTSLWIQKPKQERQKTRQILNRFKDKNTQQRKAILNKYMRFEKLPAEKKKQIRQAKRRFNNLSPQQKKQLRQKYNRLNPKQKRQAMQKNKLTRFISQFEKDKQAPLRAMITSFAPRYKRTMRQHMKQLTHEEKQAFALHLLAMKPTQRLKLLEELLIKQQDIKN